MKSPKRLGFVGSSIVLAVVFLGVGASIAQAQELVRWQDIVGIMQAANPVGSGTGTVTGGGQPWSTRGGQAVAHLRNGQVEFTVQGLVLAGGNAIGTAGTITQVKGTLVCDTDGSAGEGNSVLVDTPPVPLSPQGDARFAGFLSGPVPPVCAGEPDIAFLVRAVPNNRWIANGAVRTP